MAPELDARLNSFDRSLRAAALADAVIPFNMHCHSFFSYNGYGYSPSYIALLAKRSGWLAAGLVDFDVLDGVDEFLAAGKKLGLPVTAGMETRVFIPELAATEINSPGEPGVAYHLGMGFTSSTPTDLKAREFAMQLRAKANGRTRSLVEKVNSVLSEIALDFDAAAKRFTPGGNVTERHVCQAYREAAEAKFSGETLAAYWQEKIGKFNADPVKLEGDIRSKLMKKGGVGYVQPDPANFPTLDEMNAFILACGAVPTVAWLNGASEGEADPEKLLKLHMEHGARAVTLIPDRNWNVSDPEKQTKLTDALDRFVSACEKLRLPLLAGTEMNAPGQKLADDFGVPALKKHYAAFVRGALEFAK